MVKQITFDTLKNKILKKIEILAQDFFVTHISSFRDKKIGTIFSKSRFLSRLFYSLFSSSFSREEYSFLNGRSRYFQDLKSPSSSSPLLRRNIHRIEKGLLMQPIKIPFGLDYIEETVNIYSTVLSHEPHNSSIDSIEIIWAYDVLEEYFKIMPEHAVLDRLKDTYSNLPKPDRQVPNRLVPYRRDVLSPASVTFKELLALAHRRRSVRWFLQKPVPREMIDKALSVAVLSPSACNRQPYIFRIFDQPELVQQVIQIPYGLVGYGHNVPALAVIIGSQRYYFSERDRHLIYIDSSLAVMSFLFGLEVQGLSSCCVNWPDLDIKEKQMAKLLNLEADQRPIMLVVFGFPDPDGLVANSPKKDLSNLCIYNKL